MLGNAADAAPAVVHTTVCNSGAASMAATYVCPITTPATGNMLVMHFHTLAGGSCTPSISTATTIDTTNAGAACAGDFWQLVGASPPTTITFSSSVNANYIGVVSEWSGVNPTTPIDKHNIGNAGYVLASTCVPAALTPTQTGDGIYFWNGNSTDTTDPATPTSSPSNTFTTIAANNTTKGISGDGATAIAGSSSALTATWTWSLSQLNTCGLVLLNPAAATGITPWIGAMR